MKNLALLMATVTGLGFAAAQAQTVLPEIADADGSGTWSMGELQTVWPDLTEEVFTTIDTDGDGAVDTDELTAAVDGGTVIVPAQ